MPYLVDQLGSPESVWGWVENEAEYFDDVPRPVQVEAVLILLRWVEDRRAELEEAERKATLDAISNGDAYEDGTPIPYELFFDRYAAV